VAGPRWEYDHLRAGRRSTGPRSASGKKALTSPRPTTSTRKDCFVVPLVRQHCVEF
jgi:hypothetical protein